GGGAARVARTARAAVTRGCAGVFSSPACGRSPRSGEFAPPVWREALAVRSTAGAGWERRDAPGARSPTARYPSPVSAGPGNHLDHRGGPHHWWGGPGSIPGPDRRFCAAPDRTPAVDTPGL